MKFFHTLLILFVFSSFLSAQGWKRTIGGSADDPCKAVVQMEDEGYVLVGDAESFGTDGDRDIYVVRYDLNGNEQWTQFYDEAITEFAYDAVVSPKGEILIVGDIKTALNSKTDAYLLKINEFGDLKWSRQYGKSGQERFYSIVNSNDNGYVMVGHTTSYGNGDEDMYIVKVDAAGEEVWAKHYGSEVNEEALSVVAVEDGYVMAGYIENSSPDRDFYVIKVNEDGGLVWSRTYGSRFEYEEAKDIAVDAAGDLYIGGNIGSSVGPIHLIKTNGEGIEQWENTYTTDYIEAPFAKLELVEDGIIIAGTVAVTNDNNDIYLLKVDRAGRKLWDNRFGDEERKEDSYDLIKTMDGGIAIVGGSAVFKDIITNGFNPLDDYVIIKTDALGNINSNRIEGRVFFDRDEDGTFSDGDIALEDWPIKFVSSEEGSDDFYAVSNETGSYDVTVGTGRYITSVLNQNENYWTLGRNNIPSFFSTTYDTIRSLDFPVTADLFCPYVEVGISAPSLSICNDVDYSVSYCNIGTLESGDFFIDVEFDEAIEVNDADLPFAIQTDGSYRFDLSNLEIGACGDFSINASMACEGYVTGQAHTVKARVDESLACLEADPNWDMSSLVVKGNCDEDTDMVEFTISNVGDDMSINRNTRVVLEDVVVFSAPVRLDANRDTIIAQAAKGVTTRIIVEQSEGHPGRSFPTVAIEGCGEGENGAQVTTGFVTMFSEDDADPFVSIDVQENLEDASGNRLRAYPKGYREQNYIETGKDLVYHIQFQNLGEDALRHVVIRDTLPAELDIATVSIEASSHAYNFEIYENRILRFTFDKLNLPSINEDEAASKGFIKFRVQQMPNLPTGTVISNQALISTNFKKPLLTNATKHTVGGALLDFVEVGEFVSTEEGEIEGLSVKVGPNPFVESTIFSIEGWNGENANLQIFDATGRLLQSQSFQTDKLLFNKDNLSTGLYFYRVELDGKLLNGGKLVIQ